MQHCSNFFDSISQLPFSFWVKRKLSVSSASKPAITVQPYSFLLCSVHSCLKLSCTASKLQLWCIFYILCSPTEDIFYFLFMPRTTQNSAMRFLKDCMCAFVLFFFNYMSCSKLAMQNNNITFRTLCMYFVSKTQLLKELSLTLHRAGESMTSWHN